MGVQKAVLDNITDAKGFDLKRRDRQKGQNKQKKQSIKEKKLIENCRYCGKRYPQKQCPTYGKTCSRCVKVNHFKAV